MSQVKALPLGWKWVKLGEVSDKITDGTHFKPQYENEGVAFISVKDINDSKVSFKNCKYISKQAHQDLVKRCHPEEGDILITKSGTIGRLAIVPKSPEFSLFVSVALIKHKRAFLGSKYLIYCLENHITHLDINQHIKGGLLKNYHLEDLRLAQIQLPPLSIQAQIVEKLEALLSELDKGKAQLLTAQAQLKTYRQAVLKYAFEGKFTNKNVKDGELPHNWKWVKIDFMLSDKKKGMITGPFGMMLKKSEHQKEGVAVLGIENIGEGVFQMPNKIFVTKEKADELKNYRVIENDIIISRSGTVGEICLLPKKMENSIISTNLMRVRLNQSIINPKYFVFLFEGGKVRQQVFDLCKGSSRAFLNQSILNTLDIPYCSIEEQELIVEEIESRLSVCDKLEETLKVSLAQCETLRQSLLKRAFEGKLV